MSFELHPQLAKDTTIIGEFPLSLALLSKDNIVGLSNTLLVPNIGEQTNEEFRAGGRRFQVAAEICGMMSLGIELPEGRWTSLVLVSRAGNLLTRSAFENS